LRAARASTFLCVAVAVAFALPLFISCAEGACRLIADRGGDTDDGRQFLLMWETARVSLFDFGQFPSWNPYHCGGVVHWLDPQVPFPGPLFFALAWLPSAAGIKLWILIHLVAGALGARALARDAGAGVGGQVLCAALVCCGGSVAEHLGGGQLWFAPFLLFPWALWAQRRAARDARYAVLVASVLALAVIEGGVYPAPFMLIALVLDAGATLLLGPRRRGVVRALAVTAACAPFLAAVKLLPVLIFLRLHPRTVALDDAMNLQEVLLALTARAHDRSFPGHLYVWPEYASYIGGLPLALMLAGAALALARLFRRPVARDQEEGRTARTAGARDLLLCACLVWLAMGDARFSAFRALHALPIFDSLHVPSRFLFLAVVAGALLAVRSLAELTALVARRAEGWAGTLAAAQVVLALAVAADLSIANAARLQQGLGPKLPRQRASAAFFQEQAENYASVPFNPVLGMGTPRCYGGFPWPVSRSLWFGRGPQERLEPAGAGDLTELRWSPSEITVHARLREMALVVVNQNFDPGFHASEGTIGSIDGLLAVQLPPGDHTVVLAHRSAGLAEGSTFFLLGLALSLALMLVLKPRAAGEPGAPPPPC
jgi:hypothetical protein